MSYKKIKGFTLAEVLITLGIIGVVSALTIPQLMFAQKANRLKSQFLKSYSTIQQVFKRLEDDEVSLNPSDYLTTGAIGSGAFYKIFLNYLQAPHDCNYYGHSPKDKPCYDITNTSLFYTSFNGNKVKSNYFDDGQIALQDGTLILFETYGDNIWVSVDLNGFNNKPNRWGYDLFTFQFIDGELKTMGDKGTKYSADTYCIPESNSQINGIACANLAKNNSDYFKNIVRNFK